MSKSFLHQDPVGIRSLCGITVVTECLSYFFIILQVVILRNRSASLISHICKLFFAEKIIIIKISVT